MHHPEFLKHAKPYWFQFNSGYLITKENRKKQKSQRCRVFKWFNTQKRYHLGHKGNTKETQRIQDNNVVEFRNTSKQITQVLSVPFGNVCKQNPIFLNLFMFY